MHIALIFCVLYRECVLYWEHIQGSFENIRKYVHSSYFLCSLSRMCSPLRTHTRLIRKNKNRVYFLQVHKHNEYFLCARKRPNIHGFFRKICMALSRNYRSLLYTVNPRILACIRKRRVEIRKWQRWISGLRDFIALSRKCRALLRKCRALLYTLRILGVGSGNTG